MRYLIIFLVLGGGSALAEPHMMTSAFAERPCAETLNYIENPAMTSEGIGYMGMAFGYLLGFQAAKGGDLSGDSQTILQRIKADCAASPNMTGLELLEGYTE